VRVVKKGENRGHARKGGGKHVTPDAGGKVRQARDLLNLGKKPGSANTEGSLKEQSGKKGGKKISRKTTGEKERVYTGSMDKGNFKRKVDQRGGGARKSAGQKSLQGGKVGGVANP